MKESQRNGASLGSAISMKFAERLGTQIVNVVLNMVMARLLYPEAFGTVAIINVFIVLAQCISQNGISSAIVQKKEEDEADYSTGLVLGLGLATVLYAIIFVAAPWIGAFYNNPALTVYLRVLSLVLFPGALNTVYNAINMRKMQFKSIMISGIFSSITSCLLGVVCAYFGAGIWALIIQQGANVLLQTGILAALTKWKLSLHFSKESAKSLFGYGNRIVIAGIIDNLYYDAENLFIGKAMSQAMLGFFTNARNYPLRVISSVKDTIANVIFPAMAKEKGDTEKIRGIAKHSLQLFTFLVFPVMFGMALVAREFTISLLTEKWEQSIIPMQYFCVSLSVLAISSPNVQIVKALGLSQLVLYIEIMRKGAMFAALGIVLLLAPTINNVALGSMVATVLMALVVAQICGSKIGYGVLRQLWDIRRNLMAVVVMVVVLLAKEAFLPLENRMLLDMLLKVALGGVSYFGAALLTRNEILWEFLGKLRKRKSK